MDTLLGIPLEGWKALSVWIFVLAVPWTYSLYFIHRVNRSGVARWGAKTPRHQAQSTSGDER